MYDVQPAEEPDWTTPPWAAERYDLPGVGPAIVAQTHSIEDVLEQYIEPLGVPALYGLPMGHGDYLATTPLNVKVTLDADARKMTIDEAALID